MAHAKVSWESAQGRSGIGLSVVTPIAAVDRDLLRPGLWLVKGFRTRVYFTVFTNVCCEPPGGYSPRRQAQDIQRLLCQGEGQGQGWSWDEDYGQRTMTAPDTADGGTACLPHDLDRCWEPPQSSYDVRRISDLQDQALPKPTWIGSIPHKSGLSLSTPHSWLVCGHITILLYFFLLLNPHGAIVTNSSAAVGCNATHRSRSAFVAPILIATAKPCGMRVQKVKSHFERYRAWHRARRHEDVIATDVDVGDNAYVGVGIRDTGFSA